MVPRILFVVLFITLATQCAFGHRRRRRRERRRRADPRRRSAPTPSGGGGCSYPSSKVGSIRGTCFHIYQAGAGSGITEKNCADIPGDIGFVFPRGYDSYYGDGHIALVHFAVTKWGKYLHCNHAPGSFKYKCDGGGYAYAGRETAHTKAGHGYWYSFPAAGHDKTWSSVGALSKGANCAVLRIQAKCLFNLVAQAGRCPKGCDGLSAKSCAQCFSGVSLAKEQQLWHDAFFGGKCPFIYGEEAWYSNVSKMDTANPTEQWDRNLTWGFWRDPNFFNETTASADDLVV